MVGRHVCQGQVAGKQIRREPCSQARWWKGAGGSVKKAASLWRNAGDTGKTQSSMHLLIYSTNGLSSPRQGLGPVPGAGDTAGNETKSLPSKADSLLRGTENTLKNKN